MNAFPTLRPEEIEARSLAVIDVEVPEPRPFAGAEWAIVRRMIHTTADFELLDLVRFHPRAVTAGLAALTHGCAMVTDTHMARCGIPERRLTPLCCTVNCLMTDPRTAELAQASGTTRARAAVDLAEDEFRPAIHVIGNAPTALIRLLERIEQGLSRPALIVGMPVGFVHAAESKDLLMAQMEIPFITLAGRKGGSALAASVINALADLALTKWTSTTRSLEIGDE
ncbi:MAG: precorrin-8X methylmutase [Deltaproteobacteria bacterium]|nr:precorrin-8X methylmutase [Deltaproteobacteria bacterium]